jgi:hypothetical protein
MKTTQEMYRDGDRDAMFAPLALAIDKDNSATKLDIEEWMFMSVVEVSTTTDGFVQLAQYKHRLTRQYLHVDEFGQCWFKTLAPHHKWSRVTNGLAFDHATQTP